MAWPRSPSQSCSSLLYAAHAPLTLLPLRSSDTPSIHCQSALSDTPGAQLHAEYCNCNHVTKIWTKVLKRDFCATLEQRQPEKYHLDTGAVN